MTFVSTDHKLIHGRGDCKVRCQAPNIGELERWSVARVVIARPMRTQTSPATAIQASLTVMHADTASDSFHVHYGRLSQLSHGVKILPLLHRVVYWVAAQESKHGFRHDQWNPVPILLVGMGRAENPPMHGIK